MCIILIALNYDKKHWWSALYTTVRVLNFVVHKISWISWHEPNPQKLIHGTTTKINPNEIRSSECAHLLWIFKVCLFQHYMNFCFTASGCSEAVHVNTFTIISLEQNSAIPWVYNEYTVPISICHIICNVRTDGNPQYDSAQTYTSHSSRLI